MLFDFILMIISAVSIYTCFKFKSELDKLTRDKTPQEKKPVQNESSDEFSIGLSRLNNEFTGEIRLDSLTGLPGREAFEDRLQQTVNQSKRFEKSFAIIMMNINDFSLINSKMSYEIGDQVLQEVAKRMQGIIRQIDTVTRFAGNVFIFLLPQLSLPETAVYVAQRILDHIALPIQINNENIYLNANVGVSIYPTDGLDPNTLLKNANEALIQSKNQGPGKYQFFHQELHALGQRELELRNLFLNPHFLEKLSLPFFSQVNVNTNEIISAQAIISITLPAFGVIAMSEFMKIAANCKKVAAINEWLFKNALKQFNQWEKEGFKPKKLVLTVTMDQLRDIEFVNALSKAINEYQIKSSQVVLEILGDNILLKSDILTNTTSMLNNIGVKIAFSVLTLGTFAIQKLTQLPINYLKIDSKLVQNDEAISLNKSIIHMLVALSSELQIDLVADGVDTQKQKEIVAALGCEIMEGKLFPVLTPTLQVT